MCLKYFLLIQKHVLFVKGSNVKNGAFFPTMPWPENSGRRHRWQCRPASFPGHDPSRSVSGCAGLPASSTLRVSEPHGGRGLMLWAKQKSSRALVPSALGTCPPPLVPAQPRTPAWGGEEKPPGQPPNLQAKRVMTATGHVVSGPCLEGPAVPQQLLQGGAHCLAL